MALIFTTTNYTLGATGVGVGLAHGLGVTPDVVIFVPRATTATGGGSLISANTTTITVCAYGVGAGLFDIQAIKHHSIVQ